MFDGAVQPVHRSTLAVVGVALLLPCSAWAAIPEPGTIIYGTPTGTLEEGALIEARRDADVLASYVYGSNLNAGDFYVLNVRLETLLPGDLPTPGVARENEQVTLFVDGVEANPEAITLSRGLVTQVAIAGEDTEPPTDPVVTSPSHVISTWSNDSTIDFEWSGASDEGSGVAGYSIVTDESPTTVPDSSIEVPQGGDPHTFTAGPLADSNSRFFHLSTCDQAGNCSSAVHNGPYWTDATPPSATSGITNNSPSESKTLDLSWSVAADNLSGVDNQAFELSQQDSWTCDEVLRGSQTSFLSDPLSDAEWYFHICARDRALNWGPETAGGPFLVEAVPPTVTRVDSVPRLAAGGIVDEAATNLAVTQLYVDFSEEMNDPGGDSDPDDVTNPANYMLFGPGPDETFETVDCLTGIAASDQPFSVNQVTYDSEEDIAHLRVNGGLSLSGGSYRLLACGTTTLEDLAGKPLDGDGDENGGDDFTLNFHLRATNLLLNPNFDVDNSNWTFFGNDDLDLFESTTDADQQPTSGAAQILGTATGPGLWGIEQCVAVDSDTIYELRARTLISGDLLRPQASISVSFFGSAGCSGAPSSSITGDAVLGDTASNWEDLPLLLVDSASAQSALLQLQVATDDPLPSNIDVSFDRVSFNDEMFLFTDGFESGDTGAWSTVVGDSAKAGADIHPVSEESIDRRDVPPLGPEDH